MALSRFRVRGDALWSRGSNRGGPGWSRSPNRRSPAHLHGQPLVSGERMGTGRAWVDGDGATESGCVATACRSRSRRQRGGRTRSLHRRRPGWGLRVFAATSQYGAVRWRYVVAGGVNIVAIGPDHLFAPRETTRTPRLRRRRGGLQLHRTASEPAVWWSQLDKAWRSGLGRRRPQP